MEQESKRETYNVAKRLILFDDINTREHSRYEQERIVRKRHQKQQQQPSSVTQKNLDNI